MHAIAHTGLEMKLLQLIPVILNASIFLAVFTLGLDAALTDTVALLKRPGLFLRSILAMNVAMPVIAIVILTLLDPPRAIKIAVMTLSVSPVPPALPIRQIKAGGTQSYVIGLLFAVAVVSIGMVPLSVEVLGRYFRTYSHMPMGAVTLIVIRTVIVPLVVGMLVRRYFPGLGTRIAKPCRLLSVALLALGVLPVLLAAAPVVWALIGQRIFISLIALALCGFAIGHWLGGPEPETRTILAFATSTRHPGVAISIAALNFPDEKTVLAVVFCHVIIGLILAIPYTYWRRRRHAPATAGAHS